MSFTTQSKIDIAAPPEEVFEWLTDKDKLKAWSGVEATTMPDDPSELKVGYTGKGTMAAPDGPRPVEMEITAYDPPKTFGLTDTYAGGDSTVSYTLTPSGSGTTLEMHGETDMAAAPSMDAPQMKQVEEQIDHLPFVAKMFAKHQMKNAMEQMEHMGDNPQYTDQIGQGMQAAVDQQMQKFKDLIEVVEKEKKG